MNIIDENMFKFLIWLNLSLVSIKDIKVKKLFFKLRRMTRTPKMTLVVKPIMSERLAEI